MLRGRADAEAIIHGTDDRLLVVVGPCSIHDSHAALEYALRLKTVADKLWPQLLIVMRAYLEKPRTSVGWKGLINDPDLDGTCKINKGIELSRQLYCDITSLGVPVAGEALNTVSLHYLSDLICLGAIGARTTESQPHREVASGVPFPMGFKNSTEGNVSIAVDALTSARAAHRYMGMTDEGLASIVQTQGNRDCFVILRGGTAGTNFDTSAVDTAYKHIAGRGHDTGIVIDCSHGNSSKDYRNQPRVARAVGDQLRSGEERVVGVMLESHLYGGKQRIPPEGVTGLTRGVSVTDGCIGWEETVGVLEQLSDAVMVRRQARKAAEPQSELN